MSALQSSRQVNQTVFRQEHVKGLCSLLTLNFSLARQRWGPAFGANFVGTWNHALSVNPHAVLFAEGGEPDDVRPGVCVNDNWLIAVLAPSILSRLVSKMMPTQVLRLKNSSST